MCDKPHLSIVSPVYGCPGLLEALCSRLASALSEITQDFEIILVNDACPKGSWQEIQKLAAANDKIRGINLSRNFGQHHAITAGLDYAQGDWVVVMDCDLQDRPEEIPKLYAKAQEGFDIVMGQRVVRNDSALKKLGSFVFYRLLSFLTDSHFDESVANFSISSEKVVKQLRRMREQVRMFPVFLSWVGFRTAKIEVQHDERQEGRSSYSLIGLLKLAADVGVAHSNKPLWFGVALGFTMSGIAFAYAIYLISVYILHGVSVEGWTSVIVSVYFLGGLLLANMGLLGIYIGKTFNEGKNRPIYIVDEMINIPDHSND